MFCFVSYWELLNYLDLFSVFFHFKPIPIFNLLIFCFAECSDAARQLEKSLSIISFLTVFYGKYEPTFLNNLQYQPTVSKQLAILTHRIWTFGQLLFFNSWCWPCWQSQIAVDSITDFQMLLLKKYILLVAKKFLNCLGLTTYLWVSNSLLVEM